MPYKFQKEILFISQNREKKSTINELFLLLREKGLVTELIAEVFASNRKTY